MLHNRSFSYGVVWNFLDRWGLTWLNWSLPHVTGAPERDLYYRPRLRQIKTRLWNVLQRPTYHKRLRIKASIVFGFPIYTIINPKWLSGIDWCWLFVEAERSQYFGLWNLGGGLPPCEFRVTCCVQPVYSGLARGMEFFILPLSTKPRNIIATQCPKRDTDKKLFAPKNFKCILFLTEFWLDGTP